MEQLTVRKLIQILQTLDPDKLVLSDGCDCVDGAFGVVDGKDVAIVRENSYQFNKKDIITDVA